MIFSTLLAAIGVTPALSAVERQAALAKQLAEQDNARAAAVRALEDQRSQVNAEAAATAAKLDAEHAAFALKLSSEIASDFRKKIVPLLKSHHEEPTRKNTLAIRDAIKAFRARVEFELAAELDHIQIASAFAQVLIDENPELVSVFANLEAFHGVPIEAATAVLKASDSDYLTSTEDALYALESAVEHVARTAPRGFVTADVGEAFELLTKFATAAHRAEAMAAFAKQTGDQREAQRIAEAAALGAVTNVISDGGTGVPGSSNVAPVVVRAGVLADADDSGVSTVERGGSISTRSKQSKLELDSPDEPDAHFAALEQTAPFDH